MFLHHDLAWWGFALGVLALILMIPAAIFANAITPKIQNWWASRSRASLLKRIDSLAGRLRKWERNAAVTETEDILLSAVQTILLCLSAGLLAVGLAGTQFLHRFQSTEYFPFVLLLVLVAFLGAIGAQRVHHFREPRSPQARAFLKREIESLRAKLETK